MNYLIIGNGAAGIEAARAVRKHDTDGNITVITESGNLHYFRPKLIDYIAGRVMVDDITIFKEDWYEKNRINNILSTQIVSIDTSKKIVTDSGGKSYGYDRLCIATGGDPFVPPVRGADLDGVFTLRGVRDSDKIIARAADAGNITVMGGGLLGLETASALYRPGKNVTVLEYSGWLLPRQLDSEGGGLLKTMLEDKGLNILTAERVEEITGTGRAEWLRLKSGTELRTDLVVISAGIRPGLTLAKDAGIQTNRGIIVDDHLMTSARDVYAAGDITEHRERLYGLWLPSREQGEAAGKNMAGAVTEYTGSTVSSSLKITGIDLYSAGVIDGRDCRVYACKKEDSYMKLLMKGDNPAGAIVLGDRDAVKIAEGVIKGRKDPGEFMKLFP